MSKLRLFINPFDDDGNYTEWLDVTDDVSLKALGSVTSKLEGSDYDVGVFTVGDVPITLNNTSGRYSEVGDIRSIFRYRRSGSKVRVTWQKDDTDSVCGFAVCGEVYPHYELEVFQGVLDDLAASSDLVTAEISFTGLSYSSIFKNTETDFSALSDGLTVSEILNIVITPLLGTFSIGTIAPNNNVVVDLVEDYEDSSVQEVIEDMLLISNSVLYFNSDEINIKGRDATAEVQQTFYGQASKLGVEDMVKVSKIKSGLSRTFNLWRWVGTQLSSRNQSSISNNGLLLNEVEITSITNTSTRENILDNYRDEFDDPRREFNVTTYLDTENRLFLDRVNFSYPTPYFTRENDRIPIYGQAVYGKDKYPFGEYGLELSVDEHFKIMSIKIDLEKNQITYGVREI